MSILKLAKLVKCGGRVWVCSYKFILINDVFKKKKVNSATFDFQKKKSIPPPDLKVTHNSPHATDPDPSLGVLGQNFMVIPNIGSVWFGSVGIPSWARRPKLPVRARNSRLRVARTILTTNSESTQNLGSGRVLWVCSGFLGRYTGSDPVFTVRSGQ